VNVVKKQKAAKNVGAVKSEDGVKFPFHPLIAI
jgi:hypothetical protein